MMWWTFHTEVYFGQEKEIKKSAFLHYETDQKEQMLIQNTN